MAKTNVIKKPEERTLIFERVYDAPRQLVWQAWTDPRIIEKWWGPRGWETTVKKFELKPGGVWWYCMKCVDKSQGEYYGVESCALGAFREINEPDSFTYVDQFADSDGNAREDMPTTVVTLEFVDLGDQTKLVNRTVFESLEDYEKVIEMGVEQGMIETLDRLEEYTDGAKHESDD